MIKVRVLALSLSLLSLLTTFAAPRVYADELLKWERIPLQISLTVGKERVLFVDKNVRVGFPSALNGKLRVQSSGGAVYLKADAVFPITRLQLQDVENGEIILLDVMAADKGPSEPVRIIYSGEVTSVSSDKESAGPSGVKPAREKGTQSKHDPLKYNSPLPVLLTRYAAQSLYGPLRTIEAMPGIRPINTHLPKHITTLYPSEPVTVTPLVSWGVDSRNVVALKVQNTTNRKITLDPRMLQGQFVTATFQHRYLGSVGTPEDTTTLYLVTAGRPDGAFIAEPTITGKTPQTANKGGSHGQR